jgi:phosphate transport system protein
MMTPRTHFLYELAEVQRALLQLGAAVESALVRAMRALFHNDAAAARRVIREDDDIDERRADVEERVLQIIGAQQPLATDLRFLLAALRIADDLERMGDYAEGIAALVVRDVSEPPVAAVPELQLLSEQVQQMLAVSVKAFVARDATMAAALEQDDDRADELQRLIHAAMVQRMQAAPQDATRALHVLFVAHNLERIADRAVNIAERTAFIVTGAQPR